MCNSLNCRSTNKPSLEWIPPRSCIFFYPSKHCPSPSPPSLLSFPSFVPSTVPTLGWRGTLPRPECLSLLFLIVIAVPPTDLETFLQVVLGKSPPLLFIIPFPSIVKITNNISNQKSLTLFDKAKTYDHGMMDDKARKINDREIVDACGSITISFMYKFSI